MPTTVADVVLARLREWGVEHVFGYAGDGINGLLSTWEGAEDRPRFVQARHEEMAAFEAVGYAKLDHVPVVAIVGQTARSAMGGAYQQEVDLLSLFKDVDRPRRQRPARRHQGRRPQQAGRGAAGTERS